MTASGWGAVLGALWSGGLVLVAVRLVALRRPPLAARVLPFVRDVPFHGPRTRSGVPESSPGRAGGRGVAAALLQPGADLLERVLGGGASVRRRLERANLAISVHEFRLQQLVWGLTAFTAAAAYGVVRTVIDPGAVLTSLGLCALALALGVLARDHHLSSQVKQRERRVLAEFPTIAELLALAVAAGESPVSALDRVVRRSAGALSADLARVLAAVRTGEPVADAFDRLAAATGVPLVARFAHGIAVAMERGTPLADLMHAQAADVREAGRRELIEVAARKEVLMMTPVVFLVLPVTVLFAFWPGVVGLNLTVH